MAEPVAGDRPVAVVGASFRMASMGQAVGRWQQVLMEALAEHEAVGVRAVVVSHLGREATRSEIQAARRAAAFWEWLLEFLHVESLTG